MTAGVGGVVSRFARSFIFLKSLFRGEISYTALASREEPKKPKGAPTPVVNE